MIYAIRFAAFPAALVLGFLGLGPIQEADAGQFLQLAQGKAPLQLAQGKGKGNGGNGGKGKEGGENPGKGGGPGSGETTAAPPAPEGHEPGARPGAGADGNGSRFGSTEELRGTGQVPEGR